MKLEEVPDGGQIFVDANIFIYHFSRLSALLNIPGLTAYQPQDIS